MLILLPDICSGICLRIDQGVLNAASNLLVVSGFKTLKRHQENRLKGMPKDQRHLLMCCGKFYIPDFNHSFTAEENISLVDTS